MPRVVSRLADPEAALQPRHDLVIEEPAGGGRFVAARGPVQQYERRVEVTDGVATQTVQFKLAVPYFAWLFNVPFKRTIARPPSPDKPPWWAPPVPLDARASSVLGTLAALSVVLAYLSTLFTQTVAFAGEEFGAGDRAQGAAGAIVRLGGLLALAIVALADRKGRRKILVVASALGCTLAVTGALAPSLAWLTASQTVARAFATALLLLVAIVVSEEVPARCRAYGVSLLACAGGLGAGGALIALRLADLGPKGWRILYVIPLLGLLVVSSVRKRLPESRRYLAPHPKVKIGTHRGRLALLMVGGVLANVFIAPQTQFANRFMRNELDFSAARISLLALITGAPGIIGIVYGARIAEFRGRRPVAAGAISLGSLCTVAFFFSHGWAVWFWPVVGTILSAAAIPSLSVYGPELFPTSLRGRANGILGVSGLAGSAIGLAVGGALADHFGRLGPAMACLYAGPLLLAVLILTKYPETAGLELEDLNPEDSPPASPPGTL